jgi:hypothetical protein
LIELIKEEQLWYTTSIPIYHADGTCLAKIVWTRSYPTEDWKKAWIKTSRTGDVRYCTLDNKTLFEVRHEKWDNWRINAELYAPEWYFVKYSDSSDFWVYHTNDGLRIWEVSMYNNIFRNFKIWIWVKKDWSCSLGVN